MAKGAPSNGHLNKFMARFEPDSTYIFFDKDANFYLDAREIKSKNIYKIYQGLVEVLVSFLFRHFTAHSFCKSLVVKSKLGKNKHDD